MHIDTCLNGYEGEDFVGITGTVTLSALHNDEVLGQRDFDVTFLTDVPDDMEESTQCIEVCQGGENILYCEGHFAEDFQPDLVGDDLFHFEFFLGILDKFVEACEDIALKVETEHFDPPGNTALCELWRGRLVA